MDQAMRHQGWYHVASRWTKSWVLLQVSNHQLITRSMQHWHNTLQTFDIVSFHPVDRTGWVEVAPISPDIEPHHLSMALLVLRQVVKLGHEETIRSTPKHVCVRNQARLEH